MKKLITLLSTLAAALALSACGGGAVIEDALVASYSQGEMVTITQRYDAQGDKAVKMTQKAVIKTAGFDEVTLESIHSEGENTKSKLAGVEGASYQFDETDGEITETIVLALNDPEAVKQIVKSGVLPVGGANADKVNQISIKATKDNLEQQGFTIEKAPEEK